MKITGMNPTEEPPEVAHRAYYRQPVWKRIVVIAAGPAVNIVLAFLILAGLYWSTIGDPREAKPTNRVETVTKARRPPGVLQPGDRILAVDGKRGDPAALRKQIASHRCAGEPEDGCKAAEPAVLVVQRGERGHRQGRAPSTTPRPSGRCSASLRLDRPGRRSGRSPPPR